MKEKKKKKIDINRPDKTQETFNTITTNTKTTTMIMNFSVLIITMRTSKPNDMIVIIEHLFLLLKYNNMLDVVDEKNNPMKIECQVS